MSVGTYLFKNQVRMRTYNQYFSYLIHLIQLFLNVMPPFVRNFGFKLMLKRTGKRVFFDYGIYIKFPWLVEIGNDVSINRGAQFYPAFKGGHRIILGNDVYIAPNVCFFASGHDLNKLSELVGDKIVVGNHVWIGGNSSILQGVNIGSNCIVGAGSLVSRDIPDNSIAVGNPARVIKNR